MWLLRGSGGDEWRPRPRPTRCHVCEFFAALAKGGAAPLRVDAASRLSRRRPFFIQKFVFECTADWLRRSLLMRCVSRVRGRDMHP